MSRHLVLVGGGHSHLAVLARLGEFLAQRHRVTVVSPSPYHYYSGMGPGALGGVYRPRQLRFHVRKLALERGATFIEDRVAAIDPEALTLRLVSGEQLSYDIVSFNTGSGVAMGDLAAVTETAVAVKPIENLLHARRAIAAALEQGPLNLLVVGGGPAGVEIAGNLWRLVRRTGGVARITLLAGGPLLPKFPGRLRTIVEKSLQRRGIIHLSGRLAALSPGAAQLDDGRTLPYDYALLATGVTPSAIFEDSGLARGAEGGLAVNACLQSSSHPQVFGAGDCIDFIPGPLPRVGVHAVRQGPVLCRNLLAALGDAPLSPYIPRSGFLLILNLGDGRGVLSKGRWVVDGPPAFWLKEWIDLHFMKKFQLCGERSEPDDPFDRF